MIHRTIGTCLALFMFAAALAAPPATKPPASPGPSKPASPPGSSSPEASPQTQPEARLELPPVDPKWLDRLSKEDRAALDEAIGYAVPPMPSTLKWIGNKPTTLDQLRGNVIVIQSFTTANMAGRKWPERLAHLLESAGNEVRLIALHTPEDAQNAEAYFAKRPAPDSVQVLIDPTGDFCDVLGIYKEPVNVVIDRHGAVRYAGLNPKGLKQAVDALVAEPFDHKKVVPKRPKQEAPTSIAEFPPITGSVGKAKDFRGQQAPAFFAERWVTDQPNPRGKVVMIEFWATWCPACVKSIPHMNNLAKRFGDQICIVGISSEDEDDFAKGLNKINMKLRDFNYAIALDSDARMGLQLGVEAIPHCIVVSSDWIVRWQGNPASLKAETLEQIIKADKAAAAAGSAGQKPGPRRRWTNS